METPNQNTPNMVGMGMPEPKKSYGALIAVVIILFLIIIGGLYFLGQRMATNPYQNQTNTEQTDNVTDSMSKQSTSDETASIEADLKATNIDNIDQGAAALESEINSQ